MISMFVYLQDHGGRYTFDTEDYSLSISPCSLEDGGNYVCRGIGEAQENETSPVIFEAGTEVIVNGK